MDRGRVVASILCVVFLSAACDAALPTVSLVATPTTGPTVTPTPIASNPTTPPRTATPSATKSPTSSTTPTALAGGRWSRVRNQAAFANAGMSAVAAGDDHYVAVGWTGRDSSAHGAAWTSTDGVTWRRVSVPGAGRTALAGVVHDRIGFIAWGVEYSPTGSRAAIWTSPEGDAWQRVPDVPSFGWAQIAGVARTGTGLAAVGSDSRLEGAPFLAWTSSDGRTWRPVAGTARINESPGGLAASADVLVASVGDQNVLRSTDGRHWQVVHQPARIGEIDRVISSSGRFVAVGSGPSTSGDELGGAPGPTRAWTSRDGSSWRRSIMRPSSIGALTLVAGDGSGVVALGTADGPPFAYRSADGQTWTRMPSAPDAAREGREGDQCADGPCSYRTGILGLSDGPRGPIAVGRTTLKSGAFRVVVWVLR